MTLKIEHTPQTVNPSDELLCCFDVSKASLSLFAQYRPEAQAESDTCRIEESVPNQTGAIEQLLARLKGLGDEAGLEGLRVLADPDSCRGYERKLLQTARRLGHETALISPEHVSKLKTVESNDTGKTDHKDPRVMHLVARLGKTQTDRHLPERYRKLRRLTRYYDEDEETLTAARQRIQAVISALFPDYDKSATFTFDSTGQALMDAYAFDPYHIRRAGLGRFKNTMRRRVGARTSTLEHLFGCAEESVRYHKSDAEVALLVDRLEALWADYKRLTARRKALRAQVEAIGVQLKENGELPDLDHLKGITLFNLARLIGQTGPLEDQCPDYRRGSLRASASALRRPQPAGAPKRHVSRADSTLETCPDYCRGRGGRCSAKSSAKRSFRSCARRCSTAPTTTASSRREWLPLRPRSPSCANTSECFTAWPAQGRTSIPNVSGPARACPDYCRGQYALAK